MSGGESDFVPWHFSKERVESMKVLMLNGSAKKKAIHTSLFWK